MSDYTTSYVELYAILKERDYTNRDIEDFDYSRMPLEAKEITYRGLLELDRIEVFKAYYDIFWETAYMQAEEAMMEGDIRYCVESILL